ncbi:hypothetical protein IQ266_24915 [filamentous cyanobacterium LEGE 11480]|uniref:Uncharacterized protein n=1 Tax=Romeriopsis navalis LEGE 11480 TaxID=2777977 RepID=A0A928VQN2_9CYAN|nr:hypothetical protein [Romeriopsis navalis]MBE9032983.1 hypothetical protein [Romeriopsis navalis LEGE 11480]
MAIIALKAWYIPEYEPLKDLEKRPHDLRLSKNSLLKSGLRADFLDDREMVKQSDWFRSYLEGDHVEFYIEGSGTYAISNIDLSSHEIYFTKVEVLSSLEPVIFFSYQQAYPEASELLREELKTILTAVNKKSRVQIGLKESHRMSDGAVKLSGQQMRSIRQSLLYVADGTSITELDDGDAPQAIPSPKVCVEVGYAIQAKRVEQILIAHMERPEMSGQFPFELPTQNRLVFKNKTQLAKVLKGAIESQLQRFNLI